MASDPSQRERIADQVYEALRRAIFEEELPPGGRLSVPGIAAQLGISRSPVREAVQRLVQDGLATEEPHRGAVVTRLTPPQIASLYELREVLEGLAARLAATRCTREHLAQFKASLAEHEECVRRGDVPGHIAADTAFHAIIRDAAQNADLSLALERVQGKVIIAMLSGDVHQWPVQAVAEHGAIFDALVLGDPDRAEAAARAHIARIRQGLASLDGAARGHAGPQGRRTSKTAS